MKKIISLFIILALLPVFSVQAKMTTFADINGHWAESSINSAASMGLIAGLPDGTFAPDSAITFSEILAMLVPLVTGSRPEISDDAYWYMPYIDTAFKSGLLNGFTPQELEGFYSAPALRMIVNVLFANSLNLLKLTESHDMTEDIISKSKLGLRTFTDSGDIFNDLYVVSTYVCVSHGIVQGNEHRCLLPYSYMTRAEAVAMLLRLKSHQVQRHNGLHYVDPFSYRDYYFTCIKTQNGRVYPLQGAGRPIVKDNGIVYMPAEGIVKLLTSYNGRNTVNKAQPGDIYSGFYTYYLTAPSDNSYSYSATDGSVYGYSNTYTGYIQNSKGKKFEFHCADDKDAGLVVRSLPMLPVTDVLEYFEIPFNKITVSDAKASVTVDFSAE